MTIGTRSSKRKAQPEPLLVIRKKLRSKIPRRRRLQISPVLLVSSRVKYAGDNHRCEFISIDSSSSSDFTGAGGEVSCDSSRASVVFSGNGSYNSKKRFPGEIEVEKNVESSDFKITQRFHKRNENEIELSETSCVDSNSGVNERRRSFILKFKSGSEVKNLLENDEVSEACTKSGISNEEPFSVKNSNSGNVNLKFKVSSEMSKNDVVSVSSGFHATSFEAEKTRGNENRASEFESSPSKTDVVSINSDLACTEKLQFSFYDDEETEYGSSQETLFSNLHSEIFGDSTEFELSDYTPSLFIDSGSQFSQGSVGETKTPSPTYSLFLQYRKEFSTLTSPISNNASSVEDNVTMKYKFERFEELDDEESYQMLRKRERRQVFLWNYAETYFSTTEFGELVLQQRTQMVHWITEFPLNVQQCYRKQLRQETLFLGVSLLDRFLSKGYFQTKRNLQVVGIACLTLATRIEENQQYNRVGQKNFCIGCSVYSRFEVVAMEWMVQEVLKFQCFLPTIHSFMWFYLKAAKADAVMEKRVKNISVLALSAHEQLCYWPSTVAAALVILACLEFNQDASSKVIGIHVRSKDENLHECMQSLEWLLRFL
ncbi:hypothetical protein RIF29_15080 [Crotalaria pallida]|uniref:B-like cyclin n=1 Tax=Crotalaria pallida TaxID=3830 RepID=A0AAN9FEC9_CROPI